MCYFKKCFLQGSFPWPEHLYHYTNKAGADGILRSGWLMKSEQFNVWDAKLGDGVYLTHLRPETGKGFILLNNYGKTTTAQGLDKDKADWCFKFRTDQLNGVYCKQLSGRIVWRYPNSIYIPGVWYKFGKTEDEESTYIVHNSPMPLVGPMYRSFPNCNPMFEYPIPSPPNWDPYHSSDSRSPIPPPFFNQPRQSYEPHHEPPNACPPRPLLVWRNTNDNPQHQWSGPPHPEDVPQKWRGPVNYHQWSDGHLHPSPHKLNGKINFLFKNLFFVFSF